MEVRLLGTGDTTGTPVPGCTCKTCRYARDNGHDRTRFSIHISNPREETTLLIDASPDLRTQLLANDLGPPDAAIITHKHFDHISGLGNVYRLQRSLPVYAPARADPDIVDTELLPDATVEEGVAPIITRDFAYLDAIDLHPIQPYTTQRIIGFDVEVFPVIHPPVACYGLVITDPATGSQVGITGDTTYAIPEGGRSLLRGVDLLIADAIVPPGFCENHPAGGDHHAPDGTPRTFGTKHMTDRGAIDLADELDAGAFRLVHCSHHFPPERAFEAPFGRDGERFNV